MSTWRLVRCCLVCYHFHLPAAGQCEDSSVKTTSLAGAYVSASYLCLRAVQDNLRSQTQLVLCNQHWLPAVHKQRDETR